MKHSGKRLPRAALALALCLALAAPALAANVEKHFPYRNAYPGYADVIERDWFYPAVKTCGEVGLMNGTGEGFQPQRVLTVGEVAAIAARLNQDLTGQIIVLGTPLPGDTTPWYQWYVDYLERQGVPVPGDPARQATRLDFVALLSSILTEPLLAPMNTISALPDTDDARVLRFYNAGLLSGVDGFGSFDGEKTLTRAECAAIVARIVRPAQRIKFSPADLRALEAAELEVSTVLFRQEGRSVTAGQFLPEVLALISFLEKGCQPGVSEFNWNNLYGEQTFRDYVVATALERLGVGERNGTQAYRDFDVQVFYSRYLELTGAGL